MNRILVIRGGAIGDFVLTLPSIALLRNAFPQARLEILGYKHIVALAENRFYAQAVRSIEYAALASFFARAAELPNELCEYFRSFDLVVSYLFDPDRIFQQNLARAGVENFLFCSPKISGDEHAAKQLARPLEQLGLILKDAAARLYPSSDDQKSAAEFIKNLRSPIIALHPGSGSSTKNWPHENWFHLASWLLETKCAGSLLIVGGEADEEALSAMKSLAGQKDDVHFAIDLPLPALAAILEKCAFFLGHDSGISHIAAAVGTRSLLLFGPTDPEIWAPIDPQVRIIRSPTKRMIDLPIEHVTTRLTSNLSS